MLPHVTIILPVFNAGAYVGDALRSLLDQTYTHIDILIIDDGSTDDSVAIIESVCRAGNLPATPSPCRNADILSASPCRSNADAPPSPSPCRNADIVSASPSVGIANIAPASPPPVRIIRQSNQGGPASFNRALDECVGASAGHDQAAAVSHRASPESHESSPMAHPDFIALMHADDISLPNRIARQVEYFQSHPQIDILGTWIQTFTPPPFTPPSPAPRTWEYPCDPAFTKPYLLFWSCFAHPTMMFRRYVIEAGLRYDPAFPMPCEDYALWARASRHYPMANVPEVLLHYRVHPAQTGSTQAQKTQALTKEIRRRQILLLGLAPTDSDMQIHQYLADSTFPDTPAFLPAARGWLEQLWRAPHAAQVYDYQAFTKILAARWAGACLHATAEVDNVWPLFWSSPLAPFVDRTLPKNRQIPAKSP